MATAYKLPSGNYRVRVYDKDTGKYRSFTAEKKKQAELAAQEWLNGKAKAPLVEKRVGECIDDYIALKESLLSPTTIDKYRNIRKNQLSDDFLRMKLSDINGLVVQNEVSRLAKQYAPKTVHNAHGLISAVLKTYYPDLTYSITLPTIQRKLRDLPPAEEIINIFRGTDMELIVLLGIWQGFRVSEIRGLKKSDFKDGKLTVNRVIVTVHGKHIEKTDTKTINSRRELTVPPIIQALVDKVEGEYITTISGNCIYKRFKHTTKKHGYDITFHDLRHINASVMLALGVPDKYAMERGGWSTPATLKAVYQETFSDERKRNDAIIDGYFEQIYDTKHDTPPQKRRKFKLKRSF